jgi:hypothetical protein
MPTAPQLPFVRKMLDLTIDQIAESILPGLQPSTMDEARAAVTSGALALLHLIHHQKTPVERAALLQAICNIATSEAVIIQIGKSGAVYLGGAKDFPGLRAQGEGMIAHLARRLAEIAPEGAKP